MWSFLAGLLLVRSMDAASVKTVFCQGLGNFSDDSPFDNLPLPNCPEGLNISMLLYTRSNLSMGEQVTRSTIPSAFDGRNRTVFSVHGWQGNGDAFIGVKNALLDKGYYNVIIVYWNAYHNYLQSASDTRSIGAEIGLVAANLIAHGNSAKCRLYCVGHSLGAHVCGHAGIRTKFGRITGLDPAAPWFSNRDVKAGLNPSSADLVDVIHTDGGHMTAGIQRALGHVDFYPNGGINQPGCLSQVCNHHRSVDYYLVSIKTPCFNTRQLCTNESLLPDSCKWSQSVIQSMGFSADTYTARGIFYLTTTEKLPYCNSPTISSPLTWQPLTQ